MRSTHPKPLSWPGEQCRENSNPYFAACLQAPTHLQATCQEHQRSRVQLQLDQQLFEDQQTLCASAQAKPAPIRCGQELSLSPQRPWKLESVDSRLRRDIHLRRLFANTKHEQASSSTSMKPTHTSQQVEIEFCHPASWNKNLLSNFELDLAPHQLRLDYDELVVPTDVAVVRVSLILAHHARLLQRSRFYLHLLQCRKWCERIQNRHRRWLGNHWIHQPSRNYYLCDNILRYLNKS